MEFAFQKFQLEIDQINKQMQRKEELKLQRSKSSSGGESAGDDDPESDYIDDTSMYEKKLNILHIPHIILWKMMN